MKKIYSLQKYMFNFELGCEYKLAEVGEKTKFLYLGPGNAKIKIWIVMFWYALGYTWLERRALIIVSHV